MKRLSLEIALLTLGGRDDHRRPDRLVGVGRGQFAGERLAHPSDADEGRQVRFGGDPIAQPAVSHVDRVVDPGVADAGARRGRARELLNTRTNMESSL